MFSKYDQLSWSTLENSVAENEILLLKHLLNKDAVFLDVGSNIGAYIYMAQKSTNPANIHGFEPIPELFSKLGKTFKDVHFHQLALSNETSSKQFKIPSIEGVELMPRGTLNTEYIEDGETNSKVFSVQTKPLDSFVEDIGLTRVDLIKIDVEGHELSVLEGAKETLLKYHPSLIIEIEQRHHTENLNSIIDSIRDLDYLCCYFDIKDYTFKELSVDALNIQLKEDHKKSRRYVNNFVFLAKDSAPKEKIESINSEIRKSKQGGHNE